MIWRAEKAVEVSEKEFSGTWKERDVNLFKKTPIPGNNLIILSGSLTKSFLLWMIY